MKPTCIVYFSFPPAATSFILQEFAQYGNILKHVVSLIWCLHERTVCQTVLCSIYVTGLSAFCAQPNKLFADWSTVSKSQTLCWTDCSCEYCRGQSGRHLGKHCTSEPLTMHDVCYYVITTSLIMKKIVFITYVK